MKNNKRRRKAKRKLLSRKTRELQATGVPKQFSWEVDVELRAAAGEGAIPTFSIVAYTGGHLNLPNARIPVVVDLAGMTIPREKPPALRDHDQSRIVGHFENISNNGRQLTANGLVSGTGPDASEVVSSSNHGFQWQASIGTSIDKTELVAAGKSVQVNGRTFSGPVVIVRKSRLREISFTAIGADEGASAQIAASLIPQEGTMNEFEKWLEEAGFNKDELEASQLATLQAMWEAGQQTPPDPPPGQPAPTPSPAPATPPAQEPVPGGSLEASVTNLIGDAVSQAMQAQRDADDNRRRIQDVTEDYPEIRTRALEAGWDATRTELEVLRQSRAPSPLVGISGEGGVNVGEAIEAAMLISGGVEEGNLPDLGYGEREIEAAMSPDMNGFGLKALCYAVIRAAGRSVAPGAFSTTTIEKAFECNRILQAAGGVSNYTISGVLSNIANKFITEGFNFVESAWREIAVIGRVNDFKTRTTFRLTGDFTYEPVAPDGQIRHADMDEMTYTNKADTYGKIFAITRKDIINDDMDSVQRTARFKIGRGAGLKINELFWKEFLDNDTFFTSQRGNYFEGADSNLSIESLSTAEKLLYDLEDPDGDPVNAMADVLLVPNGIYTEAQVLMDSTEVREPGASRARPTRNPHSGKWRPVRSTYLNKSNKFDTGASETAWYLLASGRAMGVGMIEIVFLNGRQMPFVESADADFNTLGVLVRGYHDFGVNKQEYRTAVKSKGAA